MQRRTFLMGAAALLSLRVPAFAAGPITATLYKDPSCGCCSVYADYLQAHGFVIEIVETPEFAEIGRKAGLPQDLEGCHTLVIDGYVVSGHVPVEIVRKLLSEHPAIAGITLAGMPAGSPGMGGDKTEPFAIHAFTSDGKAPALYATL
jgi:hypothetical protein